MNFFLKQILFVMPISGMLVAQPLLTTTGDILQVALPLSGLGLSLYHKNESAQQEFYMRMLCTQGLTSLIKISLNKTEFGLRPNGGGYAFPSGHTSLAFQASFFIHKYYGYEYSVPAFALAGLTSYSRVKGKHHSYKDIIGGIVLSYLIQEIVDQQFKKDWFFSMASHNNAYIQFEKKILIQPTSSMCITCGHKMDKMPLSVRQWICPFCQHSHDKDVNAAKNIREIGLADLLGPSNCVKSSQGARAVSSAAPSK